MGEDLARFGAHPSGEQSAVEPDASGMGVVVDSFAGSVRVEFDHEAAFTPLGQLPFFIDFLKTAGLFEAFVADYPLRHTSPNAPKKRDVLGTAMLSMLAGHKRYAHIAALRGDGVLPCRGFLRRRRAASSSVKRTIAKGVEEKQSVASLGVRDSQDAHPHAEAADGKRPPTPCFRDMSGRASCSSGTPPGFFSRPWNSILACSHSGRHLRQQ